MITVCTTCHDNFSISDVILKERTLGDVIKVYFECPHCGTEYHVMYHNAETKELQRKMEVARANRDMTKFAKIQATFKKKLDKLNNR